MGSFLERCSPTLDLQATHTRWQPQSSHYSPAAELNTTTCSTQAESLWITVITWMPQIHLPTLTSPHGEVRRTWGSLGCSAQTRSSTRELAARVPKAAGAAQELPLLHVETPSCPREGRREAEEVRNAGGLGRMEQLSLWKPLDIQHFICFQPSWTAARGSRTGGSSLT